MVDLLACLGDSQPSLSSLLGGLYSRQSASDWLRFYQDIERYCEETQDHDADCEDDSAQTGVSILFIYQATQMLSMWAAWSLYVGIRDPSSVSPVMSYPVQQPMQPEQAYAMPVAAPAPSTASHGRDMAAAAGKHKHRHGDGHGHGKRRKESGKHRSGDKHQSGGNEYEPSSWDTPKSGKGGRVRTLVPADLRYATRTWLVGLYVVAR